MTVPDQDRRARKLALFLLPATVAFAAGGRSTKAAVPIPSPEVEVTSVVQKDVPIYSEWVAMLDDVVKVRSRAQSPWSGFKYSGVSREYGKYGIEAFLEPKAILE